MIRRPPRSTPKPSSAASDVYKRQDTLVWNSIDEKMSTDCEIMLTTEKKDTLYGVGFESNSDLKNWVILNPSGVTTRSLNER